MFSVAESFFKSWAIFHLIFYVYFEPLMLSDSSPFALMAGNVASTCKMNQEVWIRSLAPWRNSCKRASHSKVLRDYSRCCELLKDQTVTFNTYSTVVSSVNAPQHNSFVADGYIKYINDSDITYRENVLKASLFSLPERLIRRGRAPWLGYVPHQVDQVHSLSSNGISGLSPIKPLKQMVITNSAETVFICRALNGRRM